MRFKIEQRVWYCGNTYCALGHSDDFVVDTKTGKEIRVEANQQLRVMVELLNLLGD